VIAARSSHRSALRTTVRIAALLLVTASACKDSAAKTKVRVAGPTSDTTKRELHPPGEVVIAKPSAPYVGAPVLSDGSVSGTITLAAPVQPGPSQSTGRDSALCGASIPDESVSGQGNALGGAIVWLEGIRRGKPLPLERRIELESDRCRLLPRVQATVVSSAVNVIGHDDFRQHLRFLAGGEQEPRASVLLGRDEQVIPTELPFKAPGLVVVRDVDHPWPTAYIAVFDHPYYAITSPNGSYAIDGVPPGKYTLVVWHERAARVERPVEVTAGAASNVSVALQGK
jgi:hypothetical protein